MFRYVARALILGAIAVAFVALGPAVTRAQLFDSKIDGHAGLFHEETVAQANRLMEQMKKDTGKDFVIETFEKPSWGKVPEVLESLAKKHGGEVGLVQSGNAVQRSVYLHGWARDRAQKLKVTGVYLLLCSSWPGTAACVVEPESDDQLFPETKRTWLEDKLKPMVWPNGRLLNKHYDDDLLSVGIPGVWYTVQTNQASMIASGKGLVSTWSWVPTLSIIGVLLGVWVGIGALRGLVALVSRGRPSEPDPSRTRLGTDTTLSAPPGVKTTGPNGDDSVDY
jgi:hypothetical protein